MTNTGEEPLLPLPLQILKDEFDRMAEGQRPEPDPNYNFTAEMNELIAEGRTAEDILVIECPSCGNPSYYNEGFTASCHCCGYYNLADYSEEAMTLADWWGVVDEAERYFGKEWIEAEPASCPECEKLSGSIRGDSEERVG